jgi:hypothetical protein
MLFVAVTDAKNLSRQAILFFFALFILIASLTGAWSFFSKKTWSWSRFTVTVVGFFLVYVVVFDIIRAIAVMPARP